MTGAAPPCSSAKRVPGASLERNAQPTRAEPIKLKKATRGSVTRRSAVGMSHGKMAQRSSDNPASCRMATKASADNGVSSAGLRITGQPTATAGAT